MKLGKIWQAFSLFLLSLVVRLPGLGSDIFNADAFRWKARSYNFCSGVFNFNFSQTAQSIHPGVVLMWLGTAGIKIYSAFNKLFREGLPSGNQQVFELHFVQKFLVVIGLSLLLALAFLLLRKLTNTVLAFFSILILSLEPYFLANTRVFHLDALLSMFMFVSVLALLCYFEFSGSQNREVSSGDEGQPIPQPRRLNRTAAFLSPRGWVRRSPWGFPCGGLFLAGSTSLLPIYLILSAVFAGLALLTKSTALFLIPFVGLLFILKFFSGLPEEKPLPTSRGRLGNRAAMFLSFGIWILVLAVIFTVLWPAMWVEPLQTLDLYFSGVMGEGFAGHAQNFWGMWTPDPGPTYYPLSLWIRLSPWFLILAVGGLIVLLFRVSKYFSGEKDLCRFFPGFVAALFVSTFLVFIIIPSKKLERYSLPLYPHLAVIAGYGCYKLVGFLSKFVGKVRHSWLETNIKKKISIFFSVVVFGLFFLSVHKIHPDYLAYYSPFVGGLRGAPRIILPDWVIGASRVGRVFAGVEFETPPIIYVPNTGQFGPFLPGYVRDPMDKEDLTSAHYVVFPVWSERNVEMDTDPVAVVEINDVPVYNIYAVGAE